MRTQLLTRQQLEIINRKTLKYPLQTAEKDYFLAVVMQLISESSLGKTLVFKGGTALHHCFLEQSRFSEDLDFSTDKTKITLEDVRSVFAGIPYLTIKKDRESPATIKIERLQYLGPLLLPNSLKVEIDYLQNVVLPPKIGKYNNVWGLDFEVRVMDVHEICAEKIRAMSDRARYRDFYDLFLLIEKYNLDLNDIADIIRRKEIRKSISKNNMLKNWAVVGTQKENESHQIYYSREVDDEQIHNLINILPLTEIKASQY